MKTAKIVTLLLTLAMGVTLLYGFTQGDLAADGRVLLSIPWGIVSLVDVYVGFTLFSGWVICREASAVRALVWVVLIMVLGFFIAGLYTLLALQTSGGNWRRFWMGDRQREPSDG
jgi:cytochrome bd-type quinol oxidase subunit 2